MVTGSQDNSIRIWDIRKKDWLFNIPAHNKLISDLKFEKNGKYLASSSYDGNWKLWDTFCYK